MEDFVVLVILNLSIEISMSESALGYVGSKGVALELLSHIMPNSVFSTSWYQDVMGQGNCIKILPVYRPSI